MKRFLKVLPLVLLSAYAQERISFEQGINTSCSVEFEQIILDGLQSHPSIAMSKETIKGAEFEVDSAKWGYFPSPSIDYSLKSGDKKRLIARLDQPIWTGGKLDSAYDKAKAMEQEAIHELDENRYKLIESYVDALKEYLQTSSKIKALDLNKKQFFELSHMLENPLQVFPHLLEGTKQHLEKNRSDN